MAPQPRSDLRCLACRRPIVDVPGLGWVHREAFYTTLSGPPHEAVVPCRMPYAAFLEFKAKVERQAVESRMAAAGLEIPGRFVLTPQEDARLRKQTRFQ